MFTVGRLEQELHFQVCMFMLCRSFDRSFLLMPFWRKLIARQEQSLIDSFVLFRAWEQCWKLRSQRPNHA